MHETLFVVKIKRLCHFEQKLNTWDHVFWSVCLIKLSCIPSISVT